MSFARKQPQRKDRSDEFASVVLERPRAVMATGLAEEPPRKAKKENPLRSEEYRRLVADMACAHCKLVGFSQAAHEDAGKGGALKSDDRRIYPACGPRYMEPGCHYLIGTQRIYPKAKRRELERKWVIETQQEVLRRGLWPAGLPKPVPRPGEKGTGPCST